MNNLQQELDDSKIINRPRGTYLIPPNKYYKIYKQSGKTSEELLTFGTEAAADEVSFAGTDLRSRVQKSDVSLENFLGRPVKIHSFNWGTVQFFQKFNPWQDFLSNPRVANRISNYSLLKGNLHMKFLINGNGFYYGKLMVCYLPFPESDLMTTNVSFQHEDNIQMSQLPKIFLDPTLSQGGVMHTPFLFHKDYLDIVRNDQRDVGEVTIRELNPLRNVNAAVVAGSQLTVSVYAWMTEVELQAPTATNVFGITPQSGKEEDTSSKKVISQTATAVANTASAAATLMQPVVPQLAAGARALAVGASVASNVASALGYSRPTQEEDPTRYVPVSVDSVALTNTTCITEKMTVDAKQELSISTAEFGGRDEDELAIAYIAKKESFWYTFPWAMTTATESLLTNFVIQPVSGAIVSIAGTNTYFLPAIAGASLPFDYWSGSIKYRFQIVCSAYHRGKLAIVYDPIDTQAVREDNVAYTNIVDISENRDFVIEIDNHQPYAWLKTEDVALMEIGNTSPKNGFNSVDNGTLSVYVLNDLTVPTYDVTLTQDIQINVFISAGENFRLAKPGIKFSELQVGISPQSGTADVIDVSTDPEVEEKRMTSPLAQDTRVYIGEEVSSFRALLKRFSPYIAVMAASRLAASGDIKETTLGMYPYYRGYDVDGIYFDTLLNRYNYCLVTLMTYLRPAYSLMRGGIRYKILPLVGGEPETVNKGLVSVTRTTNRKYIAGNYIGLNTTTEVGTAKSFMDLSRCTHGNAGNVLTVVDVNPGISFEVPFYSQYKFIAGKPRNFDEISVFWDSFTVAFPPNENATRNVTYEYHQAAAEDFTMGVFTGWPRMYVSSIP